MVGVSPEGSGFSGVVFNYVVRSEDRVDEVLEEAKRAGGKILTPAAKEGRVRRILRRPGWLRLEHRVQRPGKDQPYAE